MTVNHTNYKQRQKVLIKYSDNGKSSGVTDGQHAPYLGW